MKDSNEQIPFMNEWSKVRINAQQKGWRIVMIYGNMLQDILS
jgi:hypothetical protein